MVRVIDKVRKIKWYRVVSAFQIVGDNYELFSQVKPIQLYYIPRTCMHAIWESESTFLNSNMANHFNAIHQQLQQYKFWTKRFWCVDRQYLPFFVSVRAVDTVSPFFCLLHTFSFFIIFRSKTFCFAVTFCSY